MLCGWASISERGTARNGKAGDQTGKEVKTGQWYYFGQNVCLRWKDPELAKKYAKIVKALCNNKHIGYDQNERITLFNQAKKNKWDYTKITNDCETDCSALVGVAVNCTLGKAVIPSYVYTGNLESLLMSTGYFKKLTGNKYLTSSFYVKAGDILNAAGHHVITVLEDGPLCDKKTNNKVAEPILRKGNTGSEVKKLQSNLNKLGFTDSEGEKLELDGKFGASTYESLCKFQKKYSLEVDGIYGKVSYSWMSKLIR